MRIEPLFNQVVLKKFERETKTASGIVLMDVGGKNTIECEVVATATAEVSVGDLVIFNKYRYVGDKAVPTAAETVIDGQHHFVVSVLDILGKLVA